LHVKIQIEFKAAGRRHPYLFFFVSLDAVEAGESFQEMHPNHKPENLENMIDNRCI